MAKLGPDYQTKLESLYEFVEDKLGFHAYTKINLEICRDNRWLPSGIKVAGFVADKRTIYISLKDLDIYVLAHEMAYAAISSYFVIPMPKKTQEILAGFAEYSVRKIIEDSNIRRD